MRRNKMPDLNQRFRKADTYYLSPPFFYKSFRLLILMFYHKNNVSPFICCEFVAHRLFILNIVPSVSNGKISFIVILDDASNKSLRPGLRADVYVVTSIKENVVMIPNRAYYSGPGEYQLWIVDGGYAEKRTVLLGESSSLYVEVIDGISPGEAVIVSNMNEFKTKDKLKIR